MNTTPTDAFQPDPAEYDALIDWNRRLGRETPFFKRCFARAAARRVLDAACGTGRHAAAFRDWGLSVVGADVSPVMLDFCRARWGESPQLSWTQHPFDRPHAPPFDALVCVGNSLAIAPDDLAVRRSLSAMLASLRPGGVLIIQVLNARRIPEGPVTWDKCKRVSTNDFERWLIKGLHRGADRLFVELVSFPCNLDGQPPSTRSATLLALDAELLLDWTHSSGGHDVELFGDYEMNPYDPSTSQDIIIVARNGAAP